MDTTEPMGVEDAAMSLIQVEEEPQSEEMETETDEAPVEDEQTDAEEVETDEDDADVDGDEIDDENEDDEDAEAAPEIFTVRVDGEEVEVSRDELTRGYAGQAYIQKRMTEVAETRKTAIETAEALQRERANLAQLAQHIQQGALVPPTPPDEQLLQTDPIGFMEQKVQFENADKQYQQKMQEFQQMVSQQTEAERQAQGRFIEEQAQLLHIAIPGMADPKKAGEIMKGIVAAGRDYGLSDQELLGVKDARFVQILNDARQWKKLQSEKQQLTEKTKKTKPTVKAAAKRKASPNRKVRADRQRQLQQTGSIDDAVALIMET